MPPSAATREDAQGPCGDPIVTDADAALGRPHAMGPPFVQRLRQRHGAEAARLHDVREDAAHLLRHNIAATQLFHRALAFHEDGDAPFPGVLLMDPLGPDRDTDHVGSGEQRPLRGDLRRGHAIEGHRSPLPL